MIVLENETQHNNIVIVIAVSPVKELRTIYRLFATSTKELLHRYQEAAEFFLYLLLSVFPDI